MGEQNLKTFFLNAAQKQKLFFSNAMSKLKALYKKNKAAAIAVIAGVLIVVIATPTTIAIVLSNREKYTISVTSPYSYEINIKDFNHSAEVYVGKNIKLIASVGTRDYAFDGWYEGNSVLSKSREFTYKMRKKDVTIKAKYNEVTHSVTSTADGPGEVQYWEELSGGYSIQHYNKTNFKEGTKLTLKSVKWAGAEFDGWYDADGVRISNAASYGIVVPKGGFKIDAKFYSSLAGNAGYPYNEESDGLEGVGTEGDPYRITTAGQFCYFAYKINTLGYYASNNGAEIFRLDADINLRNAKWAPIDKFRGYFNGGGHEISHFFVKEGIADGDNTYAGLFGRVAGAGKIHNLSVWDANIEVAAKDKKVYAGAVAGYFDGTGIDSLSALNISVTASGGEVYAGGVAGYGKIANAVNTDIKNLISSGKVKALGSVEAYAGGLFGSLLGSAVDSKSSANVEADKRTDAVSGMNAYAGGLFGKIAQDKDWPSFGENLVSSGNVTAVGSATAVSGGVVGYFDANGSQNLDIDLIYLKKPESSGIVTSSATRAYSGGIAGIVDLNSDYAAVRAIRDPKPTAKEKITANGSSNANSYVGEDIGYELKKQ